MAHEILKLKSVHETKDKGYSHAAKAGKTLYIAGQVARDVKGNLVGKGDFEAQARQVYTNLENILHETGSIARVTEGGLVGNSFLGTSSEHNPIESSDKFDSIDD